MKLDHVAIWTHRLELLKNFYVQNFGGRANEKYTNPSTGFESYFITFDDGARLELMQREKIPENANDTIEEQHTGLIHLAFEVPDVHTVLSKCRELERAGCRILSGPRKTGDGYFEFETLDPDNNRVEITSSFENL